MAVAHVLITISQLKQEPCENTFRLQRLIAVPVAVRVLRPLHCCWCSTESGGGREEPRQSVLTAFRALLSTGLEDGLLPKLCLPWHLASLVPAEHLQPERLHIFGMQFWGSCCRCSHLPRRCQPLQQEEEGPCVLVALGRIIPYLSLGNLVAFAWQTNVEVGYSEGVTL